MGKVMNTASYSKRNRSNTIGEGGKTATWWWWPRVEEAAKYYLSLNTCILTEHPNVTVGHKTANSVAYYC